MNLDTWSLALGIMLGALATGLLVAGYYQQRDARRQIRRLVTEKKKADDIMTKARTDRQKGWSSLPGAIVLIVFGVGVLFLIALLLMGGG
jgi:uncharacterized membrane protein YidH (DUF202 family)